MTGILQVTKLKKGKAPYYEVKDYDENFGGVFYLLIEPLFGENNRRFYYAKKLPDGKIQLEGEGYILTEDELTRCKRQAVKGLGEKPVWYYWLGDNGSVIETTKVE